MHVIFYAQDVVTFKVLKKETDFFSLVMQCFDGDGSDITSLPDLGGIDNGEALEADPLDPLETDEEANSSGLQFIDNNYLHNIVVVESFFLFIYLCFIFTILLFFLCKHQLFKFLIFFVFNRERLFF